MNRTITSVIIGLVLIVIFAFTNPFSWNDGGFRTVVEPTSGKQFVQFKPGIFYAGFFAKITEWPNQISVSYQDTVPSADMKETTVEIGRLTIRFNDGSTADVKGITQYMLPMDETEMIQMHNAHRTPMSLVMKRLAPYTKEGLQSSAQLMSSEMHYGGGRAQMSQDFINQLQNGVYLLEVKEVNVYDSISRENKRIYQTKIQLNKDGSPKRKVSSVKEYGITTADASITDVDYETRIDGLLAKKIDATTRASISKQELMTAQQQQLTAKAKGEQTLVEIEYKEKQVQMQQLVSAETSVKMAEQDKAKQKIAWEASIFEANKRKTLADAEAYEKRTAFQANNGLLDKVAAWKEVNLAYAKAMENSNWCPTTLIGGGGGGAGTPWSSGNPAALIDMMMVKTAKDISLDTKVK